MNFKNIQIVVLCLLFTNIFAQSEQKTIRLLDLETAMPITEATFVYGKQEGISDKEGDITFSFEEETNMIVSHINYGLNTIEPKALLNAIQEGVYYQKSITMNLYPVTVIGIKRQRQHPEESLKIKYSERMQHDAAQVLNQLPAFNSIRKGGNYGFDPVFRGFKYDQINVVLNGAQSATAACPNRMDPPTSQMAPNMMDRIEVLKGPYALRFGTGFGATINFIPAKLRFTSEPGVYGRFSTGYESNGKIARAEGQVGFSGEKYDISLFESLSQGTDYIAGNGETVEADFQRSSFGADLGFKIAKNQQIRMSAVYNRARNADFPALAMDLREDDTWLFNTKHDIQFKKDKLQSWSTTAYGSFVLHKMNNLLKPLNPRMLNAETIARTYNYGGRTEVFWRFKQGRLYAGADFKMEGAKGSRIRDFLMGPNAGKSIEDNAWQNGYISKSGLFAEYQLKGKIFSYILSGRVEVNNTNSKNPDNKFEEVYSEIGETQVNPSFSLGILKDFGEKIKTGIWLGRAQRSGSLTERFINFFPVGLDPFELVGNPQLDPEINNQADITFKWMPKQRTSINIDIYASYLQNYISSVIDTSLKPRMPSSPGVRQFVNISNGFKTGFEINWAQQLFAGLHHELGVAYTYGQDLENNAPLPEIAPLDMQYALFGKYLKNKLTPEIVVRYVLRQSRTSNIFGETETPSFALLDFKIGYQISNHLSINAGVNNVLDKGYYEHLNRSVRGTNDPIFAPGRNFFINLSASF